MSGSNISGSDSVFFANHTRKFHPSRGKETWAPIPGSYGKVPLDPTEQKIFLQTMRRQFLSKQYEEYGRMLMRALMSESEIIERKPFYLAYSRMLERHVTIAPTLLENSLVRYVAEDMIDGGEPELASAGKRMNATYARVQELENNPNQSSKFGQMPDVSENSWLEYQKIPLKFFREHIEGNWLPGRSISKELYLAAEVLRLHAEDVESIFSRDRLYEDFFAELALMIANEMLRQKDFAYALRICDVFTLIAGRAKNDLLVKKAEILSKNGRSEEAAAIITEANLNFSPIPEHLELSSISETWEKDGIDKALELGIERFKLTPNDFATCGLLAEIYLSKMQINIALPIISHSYHLFPESPTVLFHMARTFHAGYFPEQVDLCMNLVRQTNEFKADPKRFTLPVELFMKCDDQDAVAFFNGQPMGKCPLRFMVYPGQQSLGWHLNGKMAKEVSINLEEATVSKFRFHPASDSISDEISRCGSITMYTPEGAVMLHDVVKNYLVQDLNDLPDPGPDAIMALIKSK